MSRLDPKESFEALKLNVQESIKSSFPQEGDRHILDIEDIGIDDSQSSGDYTAQKKAKLGGRTFGVPIHATLVLKDKTTGKVIDRQRQKVATLPKVTNRYSYIVDGSEFQVDNQWRLKPGVYTKVKQNGELDSFFNVKGKPLHVGFDPEARSFNIQHGGAKPPLYPIMKALGVSDDTLERTWGKDILEANKTDSRGRPINTSKIVTDFAKRLDPKAEVESYEQASAVIQESFKNTALSPDVTKRTLGKPIDHINHEAMLRSSSRLLGVARGTEKPDTRDSLMFKDFHGVEDFVAERIIGHQPVIARRIGNNLDRKDTIKEIVSPDTFNRPIKEFFSKVSLANTPEQTNPLRMIGGQMKTTIAGEGGISDANRVTEDAKLVDPSHFAVLDPLHTPESGATGISLQMAIGARKQGNKVFIPLINTKTGKREMVDTTKVNDSVVALPDAVQKIGTKFVPRSGSRVLASAAGNEMRPVKMKDVQYVVPKSSQMFSLATNMVPFINSDSPNRATMAGRHMEQAIPVENGEVPLVQSTIGNKAFDELIGSFASHHTPVGGKVISVGKDSITVRGADRKKTEIPIYNNYPLNDKKGFMHSTPTVKAGDVVKEGQLIADSNFTKGGIYAPGKNLRIGYTPWKGLNFEDGVVVSESAAQKMTSIHMHKKGLSTRDASLDGKKRYQAYYPDRLNKEQFDKLDKDGIVQVGQRVKPGDTLIAALAEQNLTTEQQKLKMLHKSLVKPKKDKAVTWDEDFEGEVVEINRQGSKVEVHVKTREPMEVGDKLVGRHGNKGITTAILPDHEMPRTKDGEPIEVLMNPMCYDEETEFLTQRGWVSGADIREEDSFGTVCPDSLFMEWQRPTHVVREHYCGRMYRLVNQQLDLFVTPNHRMFTAPRVSGSRGTLGALDLECIDPNNFSDLTAEEIFGDPRRYLKVARWEGVDPGCVEIPAGTKGRTGEPMKGFTVDSRLWAEFMGWFLAEGSTNFNSSSYAYNVFISQSFVNPDKKDQIRELLQSMEVTFSETPTDFIIRHKGLYQMLEPLGGSGDKRVPREVLDLPPSLLQVFLDAFIAGDGNERWDPDQGRYDTRRLSTNSRSLVDGLQEICLKLGLAANVKEDTRSHKYRTGHHYTMSLGPRCSAPWANWSQETKDNQVEEWVDYDGYVFCASVPNGLLIVRRNGKAVVSGNSVPGRMNVGQVLETAASKVALKQGKPFTIENFSQEDNLTYVADALKKQGITDKEDLVDPTTGKIIPGIQTGYQYILKMEHQVGKKMAARDRDAYDHNLVPRGGGKHGAQALGTLGNYAMLAHGARCLMGGTTLRTRDGRRVEISDVVRNRLSLDVLCADPETKELDYKPIVAWSVRVAEPSELLCISVAAANPSGRKHLYKLKCTDNHTIYTDRGKVQAGDLEEGDWLFTPGTKGLEKVTVLSVEPYETKYHENYLVYNVEVEDHHNYVADGVLVGNSNLREMQTLKSDKSQGGEKDDLWGALQAGELLPPPKTTFAYQKFNGYLNAMGVDVRKDGNSLNLVPFTDAQVKDMSKGELKDPGRILKMRTLTPEKGGLFDEKITGGMDGKGWSHLRLSEPMPNPLFEKATMSLVGIRSPQFAQLVEGAAGVKPDGTIVTDQNVRGATYGPKAVGVLLDKIDVGRDLAAEEARIKGLKGQALNESNRRIKYLRNLKKLDMSPRDAYMMQNVPVLPPSMRPISVMEDGSIQTDDLNELYKGLGIVNKKMGEFPKGTPESIKAPIAASTYDHLKALTGIGGTLNSKHPGILEVIAGKEGPKTGFAQSVLLKRKQDMTARSTIVPEPSLSLDEAMIPRKAAKEMYKPFIVRELRRTAGATPLAAKKMIEEDDPLAAKALERVIEERPLLLKRDPVLHKYGIQAFKPRLTDGKAIKIHPLVCSGFNADFDGDQNVGIVFCLLPAYVFNADAAYWEPRRVEMTARFQELVGHVDDGVFVACNLEDFPHLSEKVTRDHIDFHPVPDGVRIVALDESVGPVLADVSGWSLHRQRRIEIVTLGSGRQILTDDDERAVYGVDAASLQWCRRRPREAENQFVPVLDEAPWLPDARREWVELPHDDSGRLRPKAELSRELGYFLGAVVGDGWVVYHNDKPKGVALACTVDEVEDRWRHSALALFYRVPTVSTVWLDHDKLDGSNGSGRLTITCAALGKFVADLVGRGAGNKCLPPFFASAPTEFWEGLLSGLWDTDGSISWSNAKSKPQFMCHYGSTSLRLQQEIQHLLRMCGVTATITSSSTPKGEPFWVLTPSIVELHIADGLGMALAHPQKRRALADFLEGPAPDSSMAYSRYRLVPLPSALARELRKLLGSERDRSLYVTLSKAIDRQYLSRDSARKLESILWVDDLRCGHPLYPAWRQLVHMRGVHFERVDHIEVTEIEEDGYDLTVPGYETFMSTDGVVLSNTMSAFVPIGNDAIKEAEQMYPSKNLFSPATHGVMYTPSHEQQVGLFMATQAGAATKEKFKDKVELEKAFNAGTVKLTDVVTVGGTKTTLGRVRIDSTLPKPLQGGPILTDFKYQLTRQEQGKLFQQVAVADPKAYPGVANAMKDIGNDTASTQGFSFGLEDFKVHKDVRDPLLRMAASQAAKLDSTKPTDAQKIVDIYGAAMEKIEAGVKSKAQGQKTQLDRLEVAAGIKGNGYRQLTAAPVLFVDGKGEVVPNPVTRSYSEGLSTTDYWAATSGGRKGIIQKVQSVSEPGYLTKMMTNSVIDTLVDTDDCGTTRGVSLSVDEPDIIGRYTTADISLGKGGKIPSGTLLSPDIVTRIKNNKTTAKLVVRSPMRCIHGKGVCAHCMGLDERGQLPDRGTNVGVMAAQALGERGTQLALKSFHSGGVYEGKSDTSLTAGGLDRAIDLLYLKKKVKGSATLATSSGKIRRIKKDPAGGFRVQVGSTEEYIPADRARLSNVRVGQSVRKGDPLTQGPVNPHDLLPLVGMSRTQGHLAGELHSIYGQYGIRRRNSEVMVRALSGVTKIEDPGGHPDLLPGDFASTTQVYDWNKKNKDTPSVRHAPVLRGVKQIPIDVQEDWMARLNHEHLKSTIIEASQRGWSSDLHGLNPIPSLIHGVEFGKGTKKKPWRY